MATDSDPVTKGVGAGSGDAVAGRHETFDGDGCRHQSHGQQIHDPDDQEDRHETGAALATVESKA